MCGRRTSRRSDEATHGGARVSALHGVLTAAVCVCMCSLGCPSPSRCGYQPILCVDCMDGMAMPRELRRMRDRTTNAERAEKHIIITEESISLCVRVFVCAAQNVPTPLGVAVSIAAACSASTDNPLPHALIPLCAATNRSCAEAVCRVNFASTVRVRNGAHSTKQLHPA
jgi:hypothetical protein